MIMCLLVLRSRVTVTTGSMQAACTPAEPHATSSAVHSIMAEDKQLLPPRASSDDTKKNKKKKKRKKTTPTTGNTEKPRAVSLPPETSPVSPLNPQSPDQPRGQLPKLRAAGKKNGERLAGSGRRSKKHQHKDPLAPPTAAHRASSVGRLGAQARESLRWEGVLEDPQAEERRLELYRANRRQRYNAHRDALAEQQTVP
ncbi:Protein LIAT1 [Liparis tanakae]|uniref:Protein LIAT1 n=1 Tax=Liparis tanakae TaxID=230148 RepID=A0A4Z2HKQ8_9TELE|nr:Protein LIAT1 [Liparis tanakae]